MSFLERFICLACGFPQIVGECSTAKRIGREFSNAKIKCSSESAYLSFSIFASLALGAVFGLASFAFLSDPALSAGIALSAFGAVLLFFIRLPGILAKRREERLEGELPFILREIAVYADIGLPYEKIISRLAKGSYEFSQEFAEIERRVSSGESIPSSLAWLSSKASSLPIKRSLFLIASAYHSGKSTEALRRMADDLSASQLANMRAQTGKLSLLAIAFIAISGLIPSFFAVLAASSPVIFSEPMQSWQVWACFALLFPFINAVALFSMYLVLPQDQESPAAEGELLESYLQEAGFKFGRRGLAALAISISAIPSLLLLLFGEPGMVLLSLCIGPAIYALAGYAATERYRKDELMLPDALYTAASTHKLLSAEKMLAVLSKGGFGKVSEAFALALARQRAGESFQESIKAASLRFPSSLSKRAFSLILVAYETGADMYFALREAAQDIVSFFALIKERSSLMAMQKYTVFASCAFLVPAILGTVVFLSPVLSGAGPFEEGKGSLLPKELALASRVYLLENALLSSIFLAFVESKPKKAALYFAICSPISQIAFSLSASV